MNTYAKYCPNVFLAKCSQKYERGEVIELTTKYGKINRCIVFNLIYERDGFFYHSIVREDGFNVQEYARKKADRLSQWATAAEKKSTEFYEKSINATKFIPMGQPILIGHHSEKRHRNDLAKSWAAMGKSVEFSNKAETYENRAEYWERRSSTINLSMPESIEYYEYELEKAIEKHTKLKSGEIDRKHSFSLTYAKKEVNEIEKKLELAKKLWAEIKSV